jgi:serine/threonine-protein kinase
MWLLRPPPPRVSVARMSLDVRPAEALNAGGVSATFLPTAGGSRTALTWTPDGQALVFVGRRGGVQQLYVRRLDAAEARPLAGTEDAQVPAVSPDGQWVAFWAGGAIRKVPLGGGPVMDLASRLALPPWGLVWDARGRVFFGTQLGPIWQIPPGGVAAAVTTVGDAELAHGQPWVLPGERVLLYTVHKRQWTWGDEEIVAYTLASGERKVLLRDAADARYLPTGHLVFLRRGVLYAVPFDVERLETRGPEVPVLDAVSQALTAGDENDTTGAGQFAVAATGTLAWLAGPVAPSEEAALVTVDRRGQVSPLPAPVRDYGPALRVSPDGRRLAVTIQTLTEAGLWLYDLGRRTLTPLTVDGECFLPVWSPDGQRLVFNWLKDGRQSLAVQPADGTGVAQVLLVRGPYPSSFTPDGGQLLGVSASGDIMVGTMQHGRATVQPLTQTPATEQGPELSLDGHWLAYGSDVSGRFEVYVQPYPGPGPRVQVSIDGGQSPAWHPNGHELFYTTLLDPAGKRRMMAIEFEAGTPPRIGTPRPLFDYDPRDLSLAAWPVRGFDVAPDGQRFYVVQTRTSPPPPVVTHINVVLNWFDELKAKVPPGR